MDIGWAKTFNLLDTGDYHPWITVVMSFKALLFGSFIQYYEPLPALLNMVTPKKALESLHMVVGIARENVDGRLVMKTDRKDIFGYTLGSGSPEDISTTRDEMILNSMNYIIAGSECTTTVLVGALNYLLDSTRSMNTVITEVREHFEYDAEMTHAAIKRLPYLNAVLREAMRLCSTIPDGMRREVPPGGAVVCGEPLPGGTVVSFHPLAAYTNESVFERAHEFLPERWLAVPAVPNGQYAADFNDRRAAFEPFSYGPRGCIGRGVAWLEMRIVLARLLRSFDIRRSAGIKATDWHQQKIYWLWDKKPLEVDVKPRY